jgi:cysteinyl-tRNA synthetase
MIAMIEKLIETGHAYVADGHVLFDVTSLPSYGELSGRNRDDMIAGARVEVAPYKKDPADFVLWKPAGEHTGWDSPWGKGRPGWHIECSAMSEAYLGETFDIHGGGLDLIFPHHENEIAQSRCAHDGKVLANYWMHNGFLTVDKEKMSKSLGNFFTVHEVLQKWPGEVIRYFMLSTHYRAPLNWTEDGLEQAKRSLDRLYLALNRLADVEADEAYEPEGVIAALEDDLNMPGAMAALHELASEANKAETDEEKSILKAKLLTGGSLLGVLQSDPEGWLKGSGSGEGLSDDAIASLIEKRNAARKARDFAESDRIRDELKSQGITLEDGPGGTTWRRA